MSGNGKHTITCVQQANAFLGEAPVWHPEEQRLYWVDVGRPAIYAFEPGRGQVGIWPLPSQTGFIAPRKGGGLIAASRHEGIFALDLEHGVTLTPIAQPAAGRPPGLYNDGAVDAKGRLWVGWLTDSRVMPGALFRVDPGGNTTTMIDDVFASNGLGWSPDGKTFYHTDSHFGVIWAYDYNLVSGTLGSRRRFLSLDVSRETPDGLQVDTDGHVWTAVYKGGRLIHLTPDGSIVEEIAIPTRLTTSCAFGGPDMETLYVTTAIRQQNGKELLDQPLAGGLFSLRPGARGQPDTPFSG